MTRARMASILRTDGEYRVLPSDSSLTAMLDKNVQTKQVGTEKVEVGDGERVRNVVYAIDERIIQDREDLAYTRPYSSMTASEKRRAVRCPECAQMRLIKDQWSSCLVCLRRVDKETALSQDR